MAILLAKNPEVIEGAIVFQGSSYRTDYPEFFASSIAWGMSLGVTEFSVHIGALMDVDGLHGLGDEQTEHLYRLWRFIRGDRIKELQIRLAFEALQCQIDDSDVLRLVEKLSTSDFTVEQLLSALGSKLIAKNSRVDTVETRIYDALDAHDASKLRVLNEKFPEAFEKMNWMLLIDDTDSEALFRSILRAGIHLPTRELFLHCLKKRLFALADLFEEEVPPSVPFYELATSPSERWFQTLRMWDSCALQDIEQLVHACKDGAYANGNQNIALTFAKTVQSPEMCKVLRKYGAKDSAVPISETLLPIYKTVL